MFPNTSFWLHYPLSWQLSSFWFKLSTILCISWLCQGSSSWRINFPSITFTWMLLFSSRFFSYRFLRWHELRFQYRSYLFSLVPSSKVLDRFNTLRCARAFCKIYVKYLNTILAISSYIVSLTLSVHSSICFLLSC